MRKRIVAGNWKMNKEMLEVKTFINEISGASYDENTELVIIPSFIFIDEMVNSLANSTIKIGAQNSSAHASGAYTGEVSSIMLKSVGAEYVILGHSERRAYYGEKNKILAQKVDEALKSDLKPIYCCGEVLSERETEIHFDVVKTQITEGLFHLSEKSILNCVIAYEPVWAIGTGVTASAEQAQEMHAFIRQLLVVKYGQNIANQISILYGGSCKPANAKELFANEDVDGGLIGGASLVVADFIAIANSFGA